jgi:hypothetical protein
MAVKTKRAVAEIGGKPVKLQDYMVRAFINVKAGDWPHRPLDPGLPSKWQHRVPVVWPERKLVPFLDRAWSDPGGTALFGPGEYLKVPCIHPDDPPGKDSERVIRLRCPLGQAGDRLWANEFVRYNKEHDNFYYRADGAGAGDLLYPKLKMLYSQPLFHAPRSAARISLEIMRVRLQRTLKMTEEDARAEGVIATPVSAADPEWRRTRVPGAESCLKTYRLHWDWLHQKRGPAWASNCWMWVLELRRLPIAFRRWNSA